MLVAKMSSCSFPKCPHACQQSTMYMSPKSSTKQGTYMLSVIRPTILFYDQYKHSLCNGLCVN